MTKETAMSTSNTSKTAGSKPQQSQVPDGKSSLPTTIPDFPGVPQTDPIPPATSSTTTK